MAVNGKYNGNETIEQYVLRRNKKNRYFCTECKRNHKADSGIGIRHIHFDALYDKILRNDAVASTLVMEDDILELGKQQFEKAVEDLTLDKIDNKEENLVRLESGLVLDLNNKWDRRWLDRIQKK